MNKRSFRLRIAIPSSLTVETADPKLRAYKIGQIARAAAIFRVDEIAVYRDRHCPNSREIAALLKYAETPQYLRRKLFGRSEVLRYAGVLPPLRMPHHMVTPQLSEGQYREGVVVTHNGLTDVGSDYSAWVDVGATSPIPMAQEMPVGTRITVRISLRDEEFRCTPEESPYYWGYTTTQSRTLSRLLASAGLPIIMSADGDVIRSGSLEALGRRLSGDVLVVFGPPDRGVQSILADENRTVSEYTDVVLNTVPDQGAATVRTEEAVFAALALINVADYSSR